MSTELDLLNVIKRLINSRQYRVSIHAVRHMIEEGFSEASILEAVAGRSKIIENYPDESRCLILGHFRLGEKVRSPLHIVCDYSGMELVDIVTAYIPQRPWWITSSKRGRAQ
ncbi:MAG TPA: DUF4258 domain-containing protein [Pyrinomonadaceae bacterium]|nr:DUF4258 domain-containing protein [Pyrinomonadaceae bacterium]